jgi:integron integrase
MKLLEEVRQALRVKRYSYRTEQCYLRWIEQYVRFHKTAEGFRHPALLGAAEVEGFLTYLAVERHVSASTQNQSLGALLFLYRDVLRLELSGLDAVRARRTQRLPVVLSREEVAPVLDAIDRLPTEEPYGLMTRLMYGAGLRLMECCRLRVKDVDFARLQIVVRQGKGDKDRIVMLPRSLVPDLQPHLAQRKEQHQRDLVRGRAYAPLPFALARKFPRAAGELGWQFLFASQRCSRDPKTGNVGRFHVQPDVLARAVVAAARRLELNRRVVCPTTGRQFGANCPCHQPSARPGLDAEGELIHAGDHEAEGGQLHADVQAQSVAAGKLEAHSPRMLGSELLARQRCVLPQHGKQQDQLPEVQGH